MPEENKEKNKNLNTKPLRGFLELLPEEQLVFNGIKDTIRATFELYGFEPLDLPLVERADVLLAKTGGETEKEMYRFQKGETELGLRFDLTVPLARYVSEHYHDLTFPFRRYQIGKVYRGEKPQKGRFREFYQCDIDIIDEEKLSLKNDAEMVSVIYDIFSRLDFGKFIVRISNRKLIVGLLDEAGEKEVVETMRALDKIEKRGKNEVKDMLADIGLKETTIEKLIELVSIEGEPKEVISKLQNFAVKNDTFQEGIEELKEVGRWLRPRSIPKDAYKFDLSIVRGLDYYTGTVYETNLVDYPDIGSICSGGRYDDLASEYSDKKLPGVGISIGLTRLFSLLKDEGIISPGPSTKAKALVVPIEEKNTEAALEIVDLIRAENIPAAGYYKDERVKFGVRYANRKDIPYVIFVGDEELKSGEFTVKEMKTGKEEKVQKSDLADYIKEKT